MTRDMDLVRQILLTMARHERGYAPQPLTIDGYEQDTIGHHVWLMREGGLITAADDRVFQQPGPTAIAESVTWAGHDFLDAVRSDTVWSKVKVQMKERAVSLPFSLIQELAVKIARSIVNLD
jgi:hypothetical protein